MVRQRKSQKGKRKVGSSWTTMRKINGKRRRVRVTKKGRGKYRVRLVSRKRKGKKRRR